MLFLLSPAKSLDYDTPAHVPTYTTPLFVRQSAELIDELKDKTPSQIAELMSLSDSLAMLNVGRYAAWSTRFTTKNSKQAVLAFNGDVYGGLDAKSLSASQLEWAQQHVAILSGLYGVLRPLDRMQPYRLEMGTRLATPKGKDLYQFWGSTISEHINERLKDEASPVIVNLASEEYFKAVDRKALRGRVIQCVFQEWKGRAGYRIISFHAKRARGLMARFAIETHARHPSQLQQFTAEGYAFDRDHSLPDRYVFRRRP